ncbi:MAG: glycoside hydrolase family 3 N-terminal domain-containing protein [Pseudomonadota bacterium]
MRSIFRACSALAGLVVLGCASPTAPEDAQAIPQTQNPQDVWPTLSSTRTLDPEIERRIDEILANLTVEEKVGQLIQADINSITPADLLDYPLGSILNGGNSAPEGNVRIDATAWLALADEFYEAANQRSGGTYIPLIWGTDAVHGHNNVVGATIFPHNIGLGATGDPELLQRIGEVTALETVITGQDWSFAPTLAVARNDRWGRTYESFSEDPEIVAAYAGRIVEGLQGGRDAPDRLRNGRVLSSAKHFLGDGGTNAGIDQGDTTSDEAELARVHGAGYVTAIEAGVEIVMASFNSWHGKKLHGHKYLLTDVLKTHWGFDGFVVGDWNGHGQVAGCSPVECPAAIMAGLDMFMAPDSWRGLYHNTLDNVRNGEITEARLDDAVRRILRVKIRAGLFEKPKPSQRRYAGAFDHLGGPAHRAVAREAVRKSLVLLKNEAGVLPINGNARVLVTGAGAHDMGVQTGGWTLSWQGSGNSRDDFPNAETIWEGLRHAITKRGGTAILSPSGDYSAQPDVAIVVYGEPPYAEFQGDRGDIAFRDPDDHLDLLERFREAGIPTVSVFLSGRPMWANRLINASDSFVAAWLPGSEGGGIADVLIGDPDGTTQFDFEGRLSFSWPDHPDHAELHSGQGTPLFAIGYGLDYDSGQTVGMLDPMASYDLSMQTGTGQLLERGRPITPWRVVLESDGMTHDITGTMRHSGTKVAVDRLDYHAQEDAMTVAWQDAASVSVSGPSVDWTRAANADLSLVLEAWVDHDQMGDLALSIGCSGNECGQSVQLANLMEPGASAGWHRLAVPLKCMTEDTELFAATDQPVVLSATEPAQIALYAAHLAPTEGVAECAQQ